MQELKPKAYDRNPSRARCRAEVVRMQDWRAKIESARKTARQHKEIRAGHMVSPSSLQEAGNKDCFCLIDLNSLYKYL